MGVRSRLVAPLLAIATGIAGGVSAFLPWAYFHAFTFRLQTERLRHSPLKWATIALGVSLVVLGLIAVVARVTLQLPIALIVAGGVELGCALGSIFATLGDDRQIQNALGPDQSYTIGYGVGVLAAIGLLTLAIGFVLQLTQPTSSPSSPRPS